MKAAETLEAVSEKYISNFLLLEILPTIMSNGVEKSKHQ